MGHIAEYAKQKGITPGEAISDRDYPLTRKECVEVFEREFGRIPSAEEIAECKPDPVKIAVEVRNSWDAARL